MHLRLVKIRPNESFESRAAARGSTQCWILSNHTLQTVKPLSTLKPKRTHSDNNGSHS